MANPIHRTSIVAKDKRSQRKVADSTTELDKTQYRWRLECKKEVSWNATQNPWMEEQTA
eukprot:COSAG04_NODE_8788_length_931_cov_12.350962_1_plen_59_part_00